MPKVKEDKCTLAHAVIAHGCDSSPFSRTKEKNFHRSFRCMSEPCIFICIDMQCIAMSSILCVFGRNRGLKTHPEE
jgi:hypothetical protein